MTGPDVFNQGFNAGLDRSENDAISLQVPAGAAPGLVTVETAGGVSAALPISVTQVVATALAGTAGSGAQPSANVGSSDLPGNVVVNPTQVAADGTSLQVVVPDNAETGNLAIVGAQDEFFLQIVPTVVQVITPATFATGQTMTIQGSGFIEGDVEIFLGTTRLIDNGAFIGPNVINQFVGAGLDRTDNDGISLQLPPGAGTAPFKVRTSGGEASLVSVNAIEGDALAGTPADSGIASANPGQTIRIVGEGINLNTQVIFPSAIRMNSTRDRSFCCQAGPVSTKASGWRRGLA